LRALPRSPEKLDRVALDREPLGVGDLVRAFETNHRRDIMSDLITELRTAKSCQKQMRQELTEAQAAANEARRELRKSPLAKKLRAACKLVHDRQNAFTRATDGVTQALDELLDGTTGLDLIDAARANGQAAAAELLPVNGLGPVGGAGFYLPPTPNTAEAVDQKPPAESAHLPISERGDKVPRARRKKVP